MVGSNEWVLNKWKEMFQCNDIDGDSNFFDLGGTSSSAIEFLTSVSKKFGQEALPAKVFFEMPSLKSIVNYIDYFIASDHLTS